MAAYESLKQQLKTEPKTWLITGVAGFIGSNLLETLLKLNQRVVGLDNFETGYQHNIDQAIEDARTTLAAQNFKLQSDNFRFIEGDIRNLETCHDACKGIDYVLHQAALGSVPRSIENPTATNQSNIDGFLNMLVAARDANVKRFVYASSSSVYGDNPDLPKIEDKIGKPLSPYAVTKLVNELYADVFAKTYGFKTIGLRYFNVFGKRQDPNGPYAAVIPKWISALINNKTVYINGDGETSRDFCYIENAVQANLLAATTENENATNQIYNVAVGDRTTLNELYRFICDNLTAHCHLSTTNLKHRNFRPGDMRHSQADIAKAQSLLGYKPKHNIEKGLEALISSMIKSVNTNAAITI